METTEEEKSEEFSIQQLLLSPEPLSDKAIETLLNYNKSENLYLERKVAFDTTSKKQWLKITKDFLAFANKSGGYILFGIDDGSFRKIGIDDITASVLNDPDNIHKKINAHIQPPITTLQTASKEKNGQKFVIVYIPESKGKTHIVTTEGKFKYPSGDPKTVIRPGEIYIRISGGTRLIQPDDLQEIIARRMTYYKETLLGNIRQVIEAPIDKRIEVSVLDTANNLDSEKVRLTNRKEAKLVAGVPSTITPTTDSEELLSSIALFNKDNNNLPPKKLLYRLYLNRQNKEISPECFKDLIAIFLSSEIPCFYWMQFFGKKELEAIIVNVLEGILPPFQKVSALNVSVFISRSKYLNFVGKYFPGELKKRLGLIPTRVRNNGAQELFELNHIRRLYPEGVDRETRADELAKELAETGRGAVKKDELWRLDCALYSDKFGSDYEDSLDFSRIAVIASYK